jgi:pSer/pThr/pTyr-binding forkhead associated (FHA) protein
MGSDVPSLPPALRYVSPAELAARVAVERRGLPFVLYLDGDGHQHIVELGAGRHAVSVGREPENDVSLEWDTAVSRTHAVLERVGSSWTIVDDGLSRNGSFLNGQRVSGRRRLHDGDAITVGGTLLVFVAGPGTSRTTATTRKGVPPELSPAQRRVLGVLCRPTLDGPFSPPASNREIADELVVSVETVKSHMHVLFELFEVDDVPQNRKRLELVRRAFERGAVPG